MGDAVQATSCLVSPFGNPDVEDLVPIAVQSIDILELGQDLRVLVQENIEGNFGDGDTFQYTSVAADPTNINSAVDIPRALQLNLVGVNANDEPIINVYIITFTNSCGTYPVLQEGQSAGWTRFVSLIHLYTQSFFCRFCSLLTLVFLHFFINCTLFFSL